VATTSISRRRAKLIEASENPKKRVYNKVSRLFALGLRRTEQTKPNTEGSTLAPKKRVLSQEDE